MEKEIANDLFREFRYHPATKPVCTFDLVNSYLKEYPEEHFDLTTFDYNLVHSTLMEIIKREGTMELAVVSDMTKFSGELCHLKYKVTPKKKFNRRTHTRIASAFAHEHGKSKVTFVCYWLGGCIYKVKDSPYLFVKDGSARWATEDEVEEIYSALQDTSFPWGKILFEKIQDRIKNRTYSSYDLDIEAASTGGGYDAPIRTEILFEVLEQSVLLGKKVKLFPDIDFLPGGWREDQCDGWDYHPALVEWSEEESEEEDEDDFNEE